MVGFVYGAATRKKSLRAGIVGGQAKDSVSDEQGTGAFFSVNGLKKCRNYTQLALKQFATVTG